MMSIRYTGERDGTDTGQRHDRDAVLARSERAPAPVGGNASCHLFVISGFCEASSAKLICSRRRGVNGTCGRGGGGAVVGVVDVHAKLVFHKLVILLDAIVAYFGEGSAAAGGELGQVIDV